MNPTRTLSPLITACLVVAASAAHAAPPRFVVTSLTPATNTGMFCDYEDLNDMGEAAGRCFPFGPGYESAAIRKADGSIVLAPRLAGSQSCLGIALNNLGQLSGLCFNADQDKAASFLWSAAGGIRLLARQPTYSNAVSWAQDMNEGGTVVGSFGYHDFGGGPFTPWWTAVFHDASGKTFTFPKGLPTTEQAYTSAINESGVTAGTYQGLAAYWDPRRRLHVLPLAAPGDTESDARAINDHGLIAGRSGSTPTLWDITTGLVETIPIAGRSAWFTAINSAGYAVGGAWDEASATVLPFWWSHADGPHYLADLIAPSDLPPGLVRLESCDSMNSLGQLLCDGVGTNGALTSYLVTPKPTP